MGKKKPRKKPKRPKQRPALSKRTKPDPRTSDQTGDIASQQLVAAQQLWQRGQQGDAVDLAREVLRQQPDHVATHAWLALAYGQCFDFQRLESQIGRLLEVAPRQARSHHAVAEIYNQLKMPHKAMASYEQAIHLPGTSEASWVELAALYERGHRLEEADALFERSLRTATPTPRMHLVRGRLLHRQDRLEEAESCLSTILRDEPESEWAAQAWAQQALWHDQAGEYLSATEAIRRCKALQLAHEGSLWKQAEQHHRRLEQQTELFSHASVERWREEASGLSELSVALLTGFPRSGTTLLEKVLDAHPMLVSSEERDYMGSEVVRQLSKKQGGRSALEILDRLSIDQVETTRTNYLKVMEYLLNEPIGERMHMDKNPGYVGILPWFLRIFPELRLLVALRDPRDAVLSCYLRYLPFNTMSVCFLTPERTAARYALEMQQWLAYRSEMEEGWMEVRYEDLVEDLPGESRRAIELLGLDWDPEVLDYREQLSQSGQVLSPSYEAVAKPVTRRAIGRWKHYAPLLEETFDSLAPFVQAFGYES